jgi:hypothetical protein
LDDDKQALLNAANILTGAECTTSGDALTSLRQKRQEASRSVFDAGKLASDGAALSTTEAALADVAQSLTGAERALTAATAAATAAGSATRTSRPPSFAV